MLFTEAATFVLWFGKYSGKTLDEIARTDSGLKYLVWLREQREDDPRNDTLEKALAVYLDDPTIARELENL